MSKEEMIFDIVVIFCFIDWFPMGVLLKGIADIVRAFKDNKNEDDDD